jgi:hypothetical protein
MEKIKRHMVEMSCDLTEKLSKAEENYRKARDALTNDKEEIKKMEEIQLRRKQDLLQRNENLRLKKRLDEMKEAARTSWQSLRRQAAVARSV